MASSSFLTMKMSFMLFLLILLGASESVFYSVNGQIYMKEFRTFLNQFVVLVCTIFFFAIVAVKNYNGDYEDQKSVWWRSRRRLVWFLGMAFFDTLALYISMLASKDISAPLRALLMQGSIPLTMVCSYIFLNRRYSFFHYAGAFTIVLGIFLLLSSVLFTPDQSSGKFQSDPYWATLFAFSCLPMALGSCLKEYVLTHPTRPQEMNLVNAWVALWQFVLGMILSPAGYLIEAESDAPRDTADLPQNFLDGFQCGVLGMNVPPDHMDCGKGVYLVWTYVLICCAFNMLMLWVIKEGTAVLFFVANAATIPLVSLISTSVVYMWLGLDRVDFRLSQVIGLVVIMAGMTLYQHAGDVDEEGADDRVDSFHQDTETANLLLDGDLRKQSLLVDPL